MINLLGQLKVIQLSNEIFNHKNNTMKPQDFNELDLAKAEEFIASGGKIAPFSSVKADIPVDKIISVSLTVIDRLIAFFGSITFRGKKWKINVENTLVQVQELNKLQSEQIAALQAEVKACSRCINAATAKTDLP